MKLPPKSFSFLNAFDNCPRKAYRMYVKRDLPRQKETEQMRWGNTVHNALKARLNAGTVLPPEVAHLEKFANAVQKQIGDRAYYVEHMTGMHADGTWCDPNAKDCWLKGKPDVVIVDNSAWIGDWKTGKVREDPFELEIFALLIKAVWSVEQMTGNYIWLSEGRVGPAHDLSDTDRTLASVTALHRQMEGLEEWGPTPNPLCGWCPVLDCEHNKVRK